MRKVFLVAAASVAILLSGFAFPRRNTARADVSGAQATAQQAESAKLLEGFASVEPIDTHTHAFHNDPAFAAMLTRLHLHLLDIVVADDHNIFRSLGPEKASARAFIAGSDGHAILCTTFDPYLLEKPGFAAHAIQQLNDDFSRGAVAVKIWKNIGMEIKKSNGAYVMPDDPIFEPIYQDIAAHHKTMIAHLAEPSSCWQPPNPDSPDYSYYKENPQWYMYLHPDHPSKETILAARDHLLEMNPKLRVVGAHLGSMETDLDEIARHFDQIGRAHV